jgi:hypothetical protein
VLVIAFSPMVVFSAFGTFLLILAKFGGVPETEAFKASGDHNEVLHLAHCPVEFNFL